MNEKKRKEYIVLLSAMVAVAEAAKGREVGPDGRFADGEALFVKCFYHACSIYYLSMGTIVKELEAKFIDFTSINALSRSAIESFLLFHYIYVDCYSREDQDYRYLAWRLSSAVRQKFALALSRRGREMISDHEECISRLISKIKTTSGFHELSANQQRQLVSKGKTFFPGVADMARKAGYSEVYINYFYKYLCGHVHGEYHQIRQIHQAGDRGDQTMLTESATTVVMMTMAFFIKHYMTSFMELSPEMILGKTEMSDVVDFYYEVGVSPMDDLNFIS